VDEEMGEIEGKQERRAGRRQQIGCGWIDQKYRSASCVDTATLFTAIEFIEIDIDSHFRTYVA
jgi:hypothetical protein